MGYVYLVLQPIIHILVWELRSTFVIGSAKMGLLAFPIACIWQPILPLRLRYHSEIKSQYTPSVVSLTGEI